MSLCWVILLWLILLPLFTLQRTPFVLQGNASLARAYRLFRTMGLHHLFVSTPIPQVIGVITRKVSLVYPVIPWQQPISNCA